MRIFLSLYLVLLYSPFLYAQLLTVSPARPAPDDTIAIIFDASKGNQALKDYSGEVYLHAGLILGTADDPNGWRHVQGKWGTADPRTRLKRIGPNKFRFSFQPRAFFGLDSGQTIPSC
ncbi:MAG: hypothetical protein AAFP92_06990 [Bacteroidota bacterium]